MKKLIYLFALAILAGMGFCACSTEEVTPISPTNPGTDPSGNPSTYATFRFNLAASSRAEADYVPGKFTPKDTEDATLNPNDLRLVIFNAKNGAVEYNEKMTKTSETVLLTAGKKKIFVFANVGTLNDTNGGATDNFNARIAEFTKGGTKTYSDFEKLTFSAGTPQIYSVDKATTDRSFNIAPLHTYPAAAHGLPASNSNEFEYDAKADVTKEQAEDNSVTPSNSGTNPNNRFNIQLYYMVAKARLVTGPQALTDGSVSPYHKVSNIKYSIKNLARYTYYTQHTSVPQSYYHFANYELTTLQTEFDKDFDYASSIEINAEPSNTQESSANYLYVPENTHQHIRRGQSSFYAINLTFEPGTVVESVTQDLNVGLVTTTKKLADFTGANSKDYIYVSSPITSSIGRGTYFKTYDLLVQAVWIDQFGNSTNKWAGSQAQKDEAIAHIETKKVDNELPYLAFTNAQSWYRLDIGEGDGDSADFGVLRGRSYVATINAITGPGYPKEENLYNKPGDPVSSMAYLNATITAAKWIPASQTGVLE
ncbi:hypothetical protein M2463_000282 [Parabacteroides sp. PH5-13]|nr:MULTISPECIES: hypothetical protein [unclassified Parabacteroides]MDH6314956.1 hypothetical protein [Parabacteroides sp. PF5-13]MDH6318293.1 hypothetical protein [Parabacteroides sp. PH5-13]MDH6392265.1 hypothetical protein [Parabacteroides sp. PFB2-22]